MFPHRILLCDIVYYLCPMFLKRIEKGNRDGKKYIYYRLCESIRITERTRHNNLLNLGPLNGLEEEDRKALANRIESLYLGTNSFFVDLSSKLETLAVRFYKELREKYKKEPSPFARQELQAKDMEWVGLNFYPAR